MHPSHKTRFSDSSLYDEVCVKCGATDASGDNAGQQACKKSSEDSEPYSGPIATVRVLSEKDFW